MAGAGGHSPSSVLLSSLELYDTTIYEPEIRALLGTAPHFCSAVGFELRTAPQVAAAQSIAGVKKGKLQHEVQGAGCRVQSAECRVQGAGCRVQGSPRRASCSMRSERESAVRFRVQAESFRFRVSGSPEP